MYILHLEDKAFATLKVNASNEEEARKKFENGEVDLNDIEIKGCAESNWEISGIEKHDCGKTKENSGCHICNP